MNGNVVCKELGLLELSASKDKCRKGFDFCSFLVKEAQVALSERLFAVGVLPYYLHLLDKVAGAAHFDVPDATAVQLHAALRARLPGYLVPRLVREVPGASGKTVIA